MRLILSAFPRPIRRRDVGFTLLEVMIAVLVFSIGLLGLAAMILTSVRANHIAQVRTQAILLAQWMGDAMRANPEGVIGGHYNGTAVASGSTNCASGCTPTTGATRDRATWATMLAQGLPAGQGSIQCALNSPVRRNETIAAFPAGLCTLSITWSESDEAKATGAESTTGTPAAVARRTQRFDWIINP